MAPPQWGDGWENVIVIGRHRKQFRNVQMIIPSAYIENWRARKVYKPKILTIMETSDYSWWDDKDDTGEFLAELAEGFNSRKKNSRGTYKDE